MLQLFNRIMTWLTDRAIRPWADDSAWPPLIAVSALTAVLMIGLFRIFSNQPAIRRARNRFLARTLELHLFRHDLRVSLTAVGRILGANVRYVGQFALPMRVGAAPLGVLYVQMTGWFDLRPLRVGEAAVVEAQLSPSFSAMHGPVTLRTSEGVQVDSPGVRTARGNSVAWRVRATSNGEGWVDVQLGREAIQKSLTVTPKFTRVSIGRVEAGLTNQLLFPSEPPLPSGSPVTRIEIGYPPRELWIGATRMPWSVAALVLVMAFGLVFGRLFGVHLA